jgi:hypothetical protein
MAAEMRVGPVCNRDEKRVWVRELHTQDTVFRETVCFLKTGNEQLRGKKRRISERKKKQEKLPRETRERKRNNETLQTQH